MLYLTFIFQWSTNRFEQVNQDLGMITPDMWYACVSSICLCIFRGTSRVRMCSEYMLTRITHCSISAMFRYQIQFWHETTVSNVRSMIGLFPTCPLHRCGNKFDIHVHSWCNISLFSVSSHNYPIALFRCNRNVWVQHVRWRNKYHFHCQWTGYSFACGVVCLYLLRSVKTYSLS